MVQPPLGGLEAWAISLPPAGPPRVTFRVLLIVFWTIVLVIGAGVAVVVSVPNLSDLLAGGSQATPGAKSAAVAAAVALFLLGPWGITSSPPGQKQTVAMCAGVARAPKKTRAPP